MSVLLYVIGVLAFVVGFLTTFFGSALVGAVYFLIAATAGSGGAIVEAIQRQRQRP